MRSILFLTGVLLLSVNIAGFFIPLRNPLLYLETNSALNKEPVLPAELVLFLAIKRNESDLEFAVRANHTIYRGIIHYWNDDAIAKYNLTVPIHENYVLHLASHIRPAQFRKYTFHDFRKAIERGVGLCSQQAIVLAQILKWNGVKSKIIALGGHVVTMAQVDEARDIWWVLDPDYGVVIEHDIGDIESDPSIIRPYYSAAGYKPSTIARLIDIYGEENNRVWKSSKEYHGKKYYFEQFSYLAKWILPAILILFGLSPWLQLASVRLRGFSLPSVRSRYNSGLFA